MFYRVHSQTEMHVLKRSVFVSRRYIRYVTCARFSHLGAVGVTVTGDNGITYTSTALTVVTVVIILQILFNLSHGLLVSLGFEAIFIVTFEGVRLVAILLLVIL